MNYLAHLLLAGNGEEWRLGAYLGDHVRGRGWQSYPRQTGLAILHHRFIDSQTDRHPAFVHARSLLQPRFRRFAGIILDVFFDHFIARDWDRYGVGDHQEFADQCYRLLYRYHDQLPASLNRFAAYQQRHNLLVQYREPEVISETLKGIAERFTRPVILADAGDELSRCGQQLRPAFDELYTDLIRLAADEKDRLLKSTGDACP